MAAINTPMAQTGCRKGFAQNVKKANPKVDMTPMVDLGFLLITFFIFTTSMNTPKTMNLLMPKDEGGHTNTAESGALTILISANSHLYFYNGLLKTDGSNIIPTNFSEIRKVIIRKKQSVIAAYTPNADCEAKAVANHQSIEDCQQQNMMVLIKPDEHADYNSIVNMLDEMTINKIARYALLEANKEELKFMH